MDHIYLISRNSDDESINLAEPMILAAKTSQKDNPHLGEAMKADYCEDFLKAMEKRNKIFDHRRYLGNNSKLIASNFSTYNPINMEFYKKKKPIWRSNQTQGPFMCTWWYVTRWYWFSQHVCNCFTLVYCWVNYYDC